MRVQGSALGFRRQCSGFRVQGSGYKVQGSGFRVQVSGVRVQGSAPGDARLPPRGAKRLERLHHTALPADSRCALLRCFYIHRLFSHNLRSAVFTCSDYLPITWLFGTREPGASGAFRKEHIRCQGERDPY